jgi:azurin
MAVYYVLGSCMVVFALVLTAIGLTRDKFPTTTRGARALIGLAGLLALVTFVVLIANTEVEHPREEAKAEELEAKAEEEGAKPAAGAEAPVVEDEYSIKLTDAKQFKAGPVSFAVQNAGKIQHDLAVEGPGVKAKTPLLDAGQEKALDVRLKTGNYKLFCTVPGHEQLGMKTEITVE